MSESFNFALAQDKKPYWVWGPLAFSLFYFLPLFFNFSYFDAPRLTLVFLVYAAFIFLYKLSVEAIGEKALIPVLGIISLATFGTFITPGTQAIFGFAAYFCGFNFNFSKGFGGLWFILACILTTAYFNDYIDPYFLAPAIIISIGLFFLGHAERKDRIFRLKDEKSQQQIEQLATIAERERIARDLHDLVGHSLSSIALKAELAEKLMAKSETEKATIQINEVAHLSRSTLAEIRHAVSGLKQINLSGQVAKLEQELIHQGFLVNTNIDQLKLSPQAESQLMLMITELITNILRHSTGDKVEISLTQNGVTKLRVFDNGTTSQFIPGNGHQGISERCTQLGATLVVNQENGFEVIVTFTKEY